MKKDWREGQIVKVDVGDSSHKVWAEATIVGRSDDSNYFILRRKGHTHTFTSPTHLVLYDYPI